jgi:hypothetical protein
MTTLSHGNMQFSDNCQTLQLINMKFCTIDYVGKIICDVAKMVGIVWLGAAPQIGETFFTIPYFLFLYASTVQTAQPIYAHGTWLKRRGLL